MEAARREFEENGHVQDTASLMFQMFTKIKFLDMTYNELQVYLKLMTQLLEKTAKE